MDHKDEKIEGLANLKTYIIQIYKELFGSSKENHFLLDEHRIDGYTSGGCKRERFLTAPFTEQEIWNAVFDIEHNKAPDPHGFPTEFYQKFWDTIKGDCWKCLASTSEL